uniref:Uncharacterized protein n=1 Tax=Cucumis melo TaxID=3656 RepID=A0A9I9E9G7_CUCME
GHSAPTTLLSIEISDDNLPPSVEAATFTLVLRKASALRHPNLKRVDCVCSNRCLSTKLRPPLSHLNEPSRRHDLPFA